MEKKTLIQSHKFQNWQRELIEEFKVILHNNGSEKSINFLKKQMTKLKNQNEKKYRK